MRGMFTELAKAADERVVERLRALLAAGADPNVRDDHGSTLIYSYAGVGDVVRALVEAGGDPNLESLGEGEGLPLCFVASWGETDAVRTLLELGAEPNLREDAGTGNSPLQRAVNGRHLETVEVLLGAGADPNLGNSWETPLHVAARVGSLPIARALVDAGADAAARDSGGETPADRAAKWWSDPETELQRFAAGEATFGRTYSWTTRNTAEAGRVIEVEVVHHSEWDDVVDRYEVWLGVVEFLRGAAGRA
jgi:ankyrin repeat protein